MRRFVVLDRDGTIVVERRYLRDPDQLELLPRAAAGLRALRSQGFGLIVVTNQSGLSRGYFDRLTLERIHSRLEHLLAGEGIALDGIYVCPHLPADSCGCRKPRPQLVHMAAAEHRFTPAECVVIGDQACDIGLGQALGATTVLVRTGYGERFAADPFINPHYIAHDLLDASRKAACNFT